MWLTAQMGPNGFGNEFVKLAKLLVCRKMLGIPIAPSYWRSPYRRAVPCELCYTGRIRRAWRLMADGPIQFGRDEHLATGHLAVEEAFASFLQARGLQKEDRCRIEFAGFDPGLETIEPHGPFLHQVLLASPGIASAVQEKFQSLEPEKIHIGVHIRRGDFYPALPVGTAWPDGHWNLKIPIEWYDQVCGRLQKAFAGRIRFFVATSGTDPEVDEFCEKHNAILSRADLRRGSSDVVDLLTLAGCDALIGSASWFTGWPVVLNPKPWLWYGCAHGAPPWARQTASLYINEPSLPEPFLGSVEQILLRKEGGK
jgi:hypothetical protein